MKSQLMDNQEAAQEKYKRAKERSKSIRAFYLKAIRYFIFSVLLLLFKNRIIAALINKGVEDPDALGWMEWNIMAVPLILMLILLVRGVKLFVFKSGYIK